MKYYGLIMPSIFPAAVFVKSVKQTASSDESEGVNTWTMELSNSLVSHFNVKNGKTGAKGNTGVGLSAITQEESTDVNGLRRNEVSLESTDKAVLQDVNFSVKDGVGIKSAEQTISSDIDGGVNEYTIKLTDGTESKIQVRNGNTGEGSSVANFTHNIPRLAPKDITSYITDGTFWKRLNGTDGYALFEDIYVGDYIKMSRPISAYERTGAYQATGSQYVTIAGLDTMWGNGDSVAIDYHHAVMVPGQGFGGTQHFGRSRMNSSNSTAGGYKGSEMNTATIGAVASSGDTSATASINAQLYAEFGSHLKTTRELVSNSINETGYNRFGSPGGCSNNWEWISAQAILMSEIEAYGSTVWGSSGYDIGNANRQLPLFAFSKQAQNNRSAYYWLKDVASAAYFCFADIYGGSSCDSASYAHHFVRPRFILAA